LKVILQYGDCPSGLLPHEVNSLNPCNLFHQGCPFVLILFSSGNDINRELYPTELVDQALPTSLSL
jgi:hypothetical protein